MIYDTSYSNKETTRKINQLVGLPFSWRQRLKFRGIGSPSMVIADISNEYKKYMNAEHYQTKANIELRPKGILIHFRHKLQAYSWVMPFTSLTVLHDTHLTLASDDLFISFHEPTDKIFLSKLTQAQENCLLD